MGIVTIIARSCLIAADIIIVGVTWWCLPRRGLGVFSVGKLPFTDVVLRDGKRPVSLVKQRAELGGLLGTIYFLWVHQPYESLLEQN